MVDVLTAVMCDDIRQETNGKLILIGVYTNDVLVLQYPVNLELAFWLMLKFENVGEYKLKLMLCSNDDVVIAEVGVTASVRDASKEVSFITPRFPAVFMSDADIYLKVQTDDGVESVVLKRRIMKGSVPSHLTRKIVTN